MAEVTPISEQLQNFVRKLKESLWGDAQGQVQQMMRRLFGLRGTQRVDFRLSKRKGRKPQQPLRTDDLNGSDRENCNLATW
jgi:hypothetical protein